MLPEPTPGKVDGLRAARADAATGRENKRRCGLAEVVGAQLVGQTECQRLAGEHRDCQPGGVGSGSTRRPVGPAGTLLGVTDHGLKVGMGMLVCCRLQGGAPRVGHRTVVAELYEEGQLAQWGWDLGSLAVSACPC